MATEVDVIPKGFWQQQFESRKKEKQSKASGLELDASKEALNRNVCQMLILPLQTHTQGIILLYPTTMRLKSLLM